MEIGGIRYKTYYKLKEEKGSYFGYIPEEKEVWIFVSASNQLKKNEKYSKLGVEILLLEYKNKIGNMLENIMRSINKAYFEIVNRKILDNEYIKQNIEIITICANKNFLIVGNVGSYLIKLYRKNKEIENITNEIIKVLEVKKDDILLVGDKSFWSGIKGIELEVLKNIVENNIKNDELEGEYFLIYVNNTEKRKFVNLKVIRKYYMKSIFFILMYLGIIVLNYKKVENKKEIAKKNVEVIANRIKEEKENKGIEEINLYKNIGKIDKKIENKRQENIKIKKKKSIKKLKKLKKISKKKFIKKIKREKGNYMSLDEEIKYNWKLLGRDENGNIFTDKF